MQFRHSNNDIISKVLISLAVIPVGVLLIILVIPLLLIAVTIFWCFMYFAKRKYKKNSYCNKYVNKKFVFRNKETTNTNENPSKAVIDAKYKSLENEDQK